MKALVTPRYFWSKFFGPVDMSVSEANGEWVKLFTGVRVWRFMFAYVIVEADKAKGEGQNGK